MADSTQSATRRRSSAATAGAAGVVLEPAPTTVFPRLVRDLREALSTRAAGRVWDPTVEHGSTAFHTELVDQTVRLPARKQRPVAPAAVTRNPSALSSEAGPSASPVAQALAALPSRSPLSPLQIGSPLFPDGIVSPQWLRRHRVQTPAVHVGFYCLSQLPEELIKAQTQPQAQAGTSSAAPDAGEKSAASVLENADIVLPPLLVAGADEATMLRELKERDDALIQHISTSRQLLAERGIKLTIVLLTTRSMLSHPSLEARLSYIRARRRSTPRRPSSS